MISQDKNFFQSIPKDNTIFYWIPSICNLLKSKSETGKVKAIIDIAKKEIKKIMLSITNAETNDIRNKYLLKMLPSIDESEILRNNEMLCYQKSLKLLEEYIKNDKAEKNIIKALEWYKKGEISGKKYIESMAKIQSYQNITGRYFY